MTEDLTADFTKCFNLEGGPVPEANSNLMKKMWTRTWHAELRGDAPKTYGLGVLGIDASELGDAPLDKMTVLLVRLQLLRSLFDRNVLHDYPGGDEFADEIFEAAATFPCVTSRPSNPPGSTAADRSFDQSIGFICRDEHFAAVFHPKSGQVEGQVMLVGH